MCYKCGKKWKTGHKCEESEDGQSHTMLASGMITGGADADIDIADELNRFSWMD